MSTEEMVERLIELCYPLYKNNSRGCREALYLDRKIPIDIEGITYSCWREYVCYKVAEYIKEKCGDVDVVVLFNGNDTRIELNISDEDQKVLNQKMYNLIKSMENNIC